MNTHWKIWSAVQFFTAVCKDNFVLTHDALRELFAFTPKVFDVEFNSDSFLNL